MLEVQTLLLRPWTAAVRPIVAAENGRALGLARWCPGATCRWLRWLVRPVLAVHEADDEPLLFTVHRPWGSPRRREVCDADGRRVGQVRGDRLLDRFGQPLAVRERGLDGATTAFRSPSGWALLSATRSVGGLRVSFAPELAEEPLLKMTLLAALLEEE